MLGTMGVITGTLGAMYNGPGWLARYDGVEQPAPLPDMRFDAKLAGKLILL
jgi:hypothetical protein